MAENIIEVKGLSKDFPQNEPVIRLLRNPFRKKYVRVLHDISFNVRKGEIFTVMGPNGAGKTTIIKILTGLLMPTEGTAMINGIEITNDPVAVRRSVSYVPSEERSFYWRLNVRENLWFFGTLYGMDRASIDSRIDEVLDIVDLKDRKYDRFVTLSAGLRQRVSIARGLMKEPTIMLLDEPTKGLDPKSANEIRCFVKKELSRHHGMTVFWASHDMNEVETTSDRVMLLRKGRILSITDVMTMKKRIPAIRLNVVVRKTANLTSADLKKGLRELGAVNVKTGKNTFDVTVYGERSPALYGGFMRFATQKDLIIEELWSTPPTLEEAFLSIVEGD